MNDATKVFRSEEEAIKAHNNIVKLNPNRKISHNLYVDGKLVKQLDNVIEEAVTKEDILKAYKELKTKSIQDLKKIIQSNNRVIDVKEFKTKDHAISKILRDKFGNKKVDDTFKLKEDFSLEESVKIEHDRYVRSHGKKPKTSGTTGWLFTNKKYGNVDYNNKKEFFQFYGTYAEASKKAKEWARENGYSYIYTME